jgi:hypothetical protein
MTVSSTPPPGWQDLCESSSAVFGTTDWQQVLESSFSCRSVYVSDGRNGAAVTAFKVGPFSVGYLGFPAGGLTGNADVLESILATLETAGRSAGLTCVRVPVSAFAANASFKLTSVSNPETAIADLQQWDLMGVSKNLRRDIRKAERSALSVERTTDYSLGPTLYGMYENQSVNVYLAKLDHDVIGFAVIVYHGSTAYYLHGGATPGARQLSPSDLVLSKAIAAARSAHCKMFNFMASPTDQPTLVRYKEKWGAETRPLRTYTVPLSAAFPLFRAAESLYRMVS